MIDLISDSRPEHLLGRDEVTCSVIASELARAVEHGQCVVEMAMHPDSAANIVVPERLTTYLARRATRETGARAPTVFPCTR